MGTKKKKEFYAYTPLEVHHAIRADRRDIAFDGFRNKVYFDVEEHIANIHVSNQYNFEEYAEESDEKREPIKPVDELDIINAEGDFVYRDAFILKTHNHEAPTFKLNAFSGLDISFLLVKAF